MKSTFVIENKFIIFLTYTAVGDLLLFDRSDFFAFDKVLDVHRNVFVIGERQSFQLRMYENVVDFHFKRSPPTGGACDFSFGNCCLKELFQIIALPGEVANTAEIVKSFIEKFVNLMRSNSPIFNLNCHVTRRCQRAMTLIVFHLFTMIQ